jgi:iron complex outermembrane receptor protein
MPRFLVSYDLSDRSQLYANVTTNARMPNAAGTYATQFGVANGGYTAVGNTSIKPEYTIGEQIGYRYNGPVHVDAAAFYMNLKNHQVAGVQYINGAVLNTAIEAGGETIRGASLEASTASYSGLSFYGNTQYLDGTFADNIPLRGDFLPTKGKQMVESPKWIGALGGRYENGPFFADVTWKHVGSQYTTFVNDEAISPYNTVDLALGYHLPSNGIFKSTVIRLNLTNLSNKSYVSSVGSVATNRVATHGINGTAMPAGTPTYYVAAPFSALVTISTDF